MFIAQARRPSTRRSYNYKIERFRAWCTERVIDPFQATVPNIADFLCMLYHSDLAVSTIATYKSALTSILPWVSQGDKLDRLIRGMGNLRPRQQQPIPVWSLQLVLYVLAEPPFEPIESIDIKLLTFKAVFLTAAASA